MGRIIRHESQDAALPGESDMVPSHVAFAVWPTWGHPQRRRLMALGAENEGKGVCFLPLSMLAAWYKERGGRVWWSELREPWEGSHIVGHAVEHLGTPYPNDAEMLAIIRPRLRWFLKLIGHAAGKRTLHCSAFMTRGIVDAGYILNKPPHMMRPVDMVGLTCWKQRVELFF